MSYLTTNSSPAFIFLRATHRTTDRLIEYLALGLHAELTNEIGPSIRKVLFIFLLVVFREKSLYPSRWSSSGSSLRKPLTPGITFPRSKSILAVKPNWLKLSDLIKSTGSYETNLLLSWYWLSRNASNCSASRSTLTFHSPTSILCYLTNSLST